MFTIKKIFSAKYDVKKSIFLSFLTPIERFDSLKEELSMKHQKANHIVWAYRFLNKFDQLVEDSSDDGEPKGTSGFPSLNVLRGENLIFCGTLIVRYFGGIKLGTGGLVRAYSSSVQEVIKVAELIKYEKTFLVVFEVSYQLLQRFEHFFKANSYPNYLKDFDEKGATISFNISKQQIEKLKIFSKNFPDIHIKVLK